MKTLAITLLAFVSVSPVVAQGTINKAVPIKAGQKLKVTVDYPKVRVTTWDKDEIAVSAFVNVNGGENNDIFSLTSNAEGNTVTIKGAVKNLDAIPHRVTVELDGKKMIFKNRAEYEKYANEHGRGATRMSEGVDIDITVEIKVPTGIETTVSSTYGIVEVKSYVGAIRAESTYGGVDASIVEKSTGQLTAETNYGHIYSNLNISPGSGKVKEEDFHTYVSGKLGSGPNASFESKFGNVYLRREN